MSELTTARLAEIKLREALRILSEGQPTYAKTDYHDDGGMTVQYNNVLECNISAAGVLTSVKELDLVG
jgi:hypothetical protein